MSPFLVIPYPDIDPVFFEVGPLAFRWYALSYVLGLVLGWLYVRRMAQEPPSVMTRPQVDDLLLWATLGVVLGGRLGYVLFYKPGFYLDHPLQALAVWQGGMSFHGGLLGVAIAIALFAQGQRLRLLRVADVVAAAAPIGLFFGRMANFINGELWGRPTDVPWAMVFPHAGDVPRHPSQLYEAFLEGIVLLAVIWAARRWWDIARWPGMTAGIFCIGYALARIAVEFVREPDPHLGLLAGIVTMGQILSLPLFAVGVYLVWRSRRVEPALP